MPSFLWAALMIILVVICGLVASEQNVTHTKAIDSKQNSEQFPLRSRDGGTKMCAIGIGVCMQGTCTITAKVQDGTGEIYSHSVGSPNTITYMAESSHPLDMQMPAGNGYILQPATLNEKDSQGTCAQTYFVGPTAGRNVPPLADQFKFFIN